MVKPAVAAAAEGVLSPEWKLTQPMLAASDETVVTRAQRRNEADLFIVKVD
jgi:hypothetical protein